MWLRALASLAEDPGSIPSTWLCNSGSGGLSSLFSTPRGTRHSGTRDTHAGQLPTHLKQKSIFLKFIFKLLSAHMLGRHSKYLCWVNDYWNCGQHTVLMCVCLPHRETTLGLLHATLSLPSSFLKWLQRRRGSFVVIFSSSPEKSLQTSTFLARVETLGRSRLQPSDLKS